MGGCDGIGLGVLGVAAFFEDRLVWTRLAVQKLAGSLPPLQAPVSTASKNRWLKSAGAVLLLKAPPFSWWQEKQLVRPLAFWAKVSMVVLAFSVEPFSLDADGGSCPWFVHRFPARK